MREETGVDVRIVRALGVEQYDMWPSKPELHERRFFQLTPRGDSPADQWRAGFGARLGQIILEAGNGATVEGGKLEHSVMVLRAGTRWSSAFQTDTLSDRIQF